MPLKDPDLGGEKEPRRLPRVNELKNHPETQTAAKEATGIAWQDGDWVFTRPDGHHLDPDGLSHTLEKLVRSLGLPRVRFHDLRHTHATLFFVEDVHPNIFEERFGHSTASITLDTYSHVIPGLQERAVFASKAALEPALEEDR